jgi:hypothetical protein
MSQTVFYTAVDGSVVSALNARKSYYNATVRNAGAHAWLFQKMAYAVASAKTKTGEAASIDLPLGGGLSSNGMYQSADNGYWPKPHITSVSVSAEGDFGSIKKCEISFTVYTIGQLSAHQPFLMPGATVSVSYGWKDAGGAGGPAGNFKGVINNFSFSVNQAGGFDCITYAIGPGIDAISGNVNGSFPSNGKQIADDLGNDINADSLPNKLKYLIQKNKDLAHNAINTADVSADGGIGCLEFPSSFGSAANAEEAKKSAGEDSEDIKHYYISLEALVKIILSEVIHKGKPRQEPSGDTFKLENVNILCDGNTTLGNVPAAGSEVLVSGNPLEICFPGCGTYGSKHDWNFPDFSGAFLGGDLSKTMISIEWLQKKINEELPNRKDGTKGPDRSIAKFLNLIFDTINANSGTRFKLSLTQNPKPEKAYEFFIVDTDFIDSEVAPYVISAVTQDSICRNISLVSKVPSDLTAAIAIATTSTFANGGGIGNIIGKGPDEPGKDDALTSFVAAKKKLDGAEVTIEDINAMRDSVQRMYLGSTNPGHDLGKEWIPIPIDFSCTLDGIEGFIFGNAITTNYLPSKFTGDKFVYTVTTVKQTIADNDWTTTLNTVCRAKPI